MNTLTEQAKRIAGHIQQPMTETELADYLASDNYNSELALQHALLLFTTQNKMNTPKTENTVVDLIRKRGEIGRQKYSATIDRSDLTPSQCVLRFSALVLLVCSFCFFFDFRD